MKWVTAEIEYLNKLKEQKTAKELEKILDRKAEYIRAKCRELGIKLKVDWNMENGQKWNPEEIKHLENQNKINPNGIPIEDLQRFLNRSETSIKMKCQILHLKLNREKKYEMRGKENETIIRRYSTNNKWKTAKELSLLLRISVSRIASFRLKNKLHYPHRNIYNVSTICQKCGKPFINKCGQNISKFCSWNCHAKSRQGKNITPLERRICETCGKPFRVHKWDKQRFCSYGCVKRKSKTLALDDFLKSKYPLILKEFWREKHKIERELKLI